MMAEKGKMNLKFIFHYIKKRVRLKGINYTSKWNVNKLLEIRLIKKWVNMH